MVVEGAREVFEWPYTVGGGGDPWTPCPQPKSPSLETTKLSIGKILPGHFWYTTFWSPPPTSKGKQSNTEALCQPPPPNPPPLSSNTNPPQPHLHLRARMGERTARDLGRVAPRRIPHRMEAQVLPSRRDTLGVAGGVRALYICIQLYIDELSPANPLIPSIALASRT